ncbi:unnamed protein product [Gongylonema pulchrum]|uniref:DUF1778 domain-containing protein n=1 Tax=Gongylonema pulchrum TaxID=637853 RepID=A0A183D903_9BILA|nr:unnamed protein product [Gongylonema pulchrum]
MQMNGMTRDGMRAATFRLSAEDPSCEKFSNGTISPSAKSEEKEISKVEEWSQHDQRLFETALQQFPKGTADR